MASNASYIISRQRSVKIAGALGDGTTDATAAFAAAMTAIVSAGAGRILIPQGTYLLNGGTASADGYKNGLLVPFLQVNADEKKTIVIEGEGGSVLKCGSNNMMLTRIARNNVRLNNVTLDCNSKTGVVLCGIVPEDITQTSTQVSQSYCTLDEVNRVGGASVDGILIQPGPRVTGSDSGCFYHNIIGGVSNFVGGGRHVYLKKGPTWATDANRPTRTNFIGQRLVRGNVGYYMEVGSEILLEGCNEELITSGVTPLATPTARYVTSDCSNIRFVGGYSEGCSASFEGPTSTVVASYGYIPASGSDTTFRARVSSYDDGISPVALTVTLTSSGGGAQGASNSAGLAYKAGKLVSFQIEVNVAKGTLAAGNLSLNSVLPWSVSTTAPSLGGISVSQTGAITLGAGYDAVGGFITGSSITLRKFSTTGTGSAALTLAECGDPVQLIISGSYIAS